MRNVFYPLLVALLAVAFGCGSDSSEDDEGHGKKTEADFKIPVRIEKPSRGQVEDWVETQANIESDRRAMILAEVEGRIVEKRADLGQRIEPAGNGESDVVLARIDDRDLKLGLREAQIKVREMRGRLEELEVDLQRAGRALEQTELEAEESESVLRRTTNGIKDGTITGEEHEAAQFAAKVAHAKVSTIEADEQKTKLEVKLGAVAIEDAEAKEERARIALDKTQVRAPFPGVVSFANVHVGERVRVGDHLFTVEDPSQVVVYGEIPVRQANRVRRGNPVRFGSSALPHTTSGRVELVAPTVDSASGTIRVKMSLNAKEGFRPGLFVTVRIVVETRKDALVVPKRAVLHDDETGPYLFVVRDAGSGQRAYRVNIRTGFGRDDVIEVIEGVDPNDDIVVEGQDTVTHEATVEVGTPESTEE